MAGRSLMKPSFDEVASRISAAGTNFKGRDCSVTVCAWCCLSHPAFRSGPMLHAKFCCPGGGHPHMRQRPIISCLAGFAATWPFAAHGQELMPPTHAAINLPRIEMVRVKQIGLLAPNVQMRLRDGEIDLMKPSDLGGSDGIGSAWKMPSVTKFQERFGQW
jgi:hypothetical protein